jgi:hypothetical protein
MSRFLAFKSANAAAPEQAGKVRQINGRNATVF